MRLTCHRACRRLDAWIELSPAERREVSVHAEACASCRPVWEATQKAFERLEAAHVVWGETRYQGRVPDLGTHKESLGSWWAVLDRRHLASLAAAAALVVLNLRLVGPPAESPNKPAEASAQRATTAPRPRLPTLRSRPSSVGLSGFGSLARPTRPPGGLSLRMPSRPSQGAVGSQSNQKNKTFERGVGKGRRDS